MENKPTIQSLKIYEVAKAHLGEDLSPIENIFGCQESVSTVLKLSFGDTYQSRSTREWYEHALKSPYYIQVTSPCEGDILTSPTGYATESSPIKNGHCAIVGKDGLLMSNDSQTSRFIQNYTLDTWKKRYVDIGKYPMIFFRRII